MTAFKYTAVDIHVELFRRLGIGIFGEGRGRRSLRLCCKVARGEEKTENMSKLL